MKTFELHAEIDLPLPLEEVFAFFADAGNLEAITPPWLHFRTLSPQPIAMRPGALIDYRIRLQGVPLRWRSEITAWEPPHRFVDEQVRGPYRLWHHEHTFRDLGGRTRVVDHVRYAVWGGAPFEGLIERLFVRSRLEGIFRHRQQRIAELLGVEAIPVPAGAAPGSRSTPLDSARLR
jgi:ligand-binding SRPBCC domain-containing protein